jgi:ribosomal protein S18 acetylase RimI-like enzyme
VRNVAESRSSSRNARLAEPPRPTPRRFDSEVTATTTEGVEIVSAGPELRELFALAKGSFGDRPDWSDLVVLGVLERDVVFVARARDEPAGYVALRTSGDRTVTVEQLFVAPGHERHGIGRRLLAYAEGYAIARRARALRIVVEERNVEARGFYRRSGFVPVGSELLELILPSTD